MAAIADGVELSLKLFVDTLARANLVQVDPVGEPFDPKLHQAVSMVESDTAEPGSVLQVLQKGYTLNGRLVRPGDGDRRQNPGRIQQLTVEVSRRAPI